MACNGAYTARSVATQACDARGVNLQAHAGSCPGVAQYCCGYAPPTIECAAYLSDRQCRHHEGCEWNSLAGCRAAP